MYVKEGKNNEYAENHLITLLTSYYRKKLRHKSLSNDPSNIDAAEIAKLYVN